MIIDISESKEVFTVSRLNREVRFILEGSFPILWVEGEISNFTIPNSGHWYFSLKDANAQVRCAMFRQQNRNIGMIPKDGMHVLMKVRVSLYEGRGDFQLLVEQMEEAGEGKLRQAFEVMKKRLDAAGLFDPAHKQKLPTFPKTIGVITSHTGAAIRDILSVLKRRCSYINVIIYKTLVQGETAAASIVSAIQTANHRAECDVLILARGGGSLEDLWPFNEEKVAYAIHQSHLPIISGVGHEIDFTIADFVADLRAPTPSAAAELVATNCEELSETIRQEQRHLLRLLTQKLEQLKQNIIWINKHLSQQHPKRRLAEQSQRLDLYEVSLVRLENKLLLSFQNKLQAIQAQLLRFTPEHRIKEFLRHSVHDTKHLINCMNQALQNKQKLLGNLAAKLDALSPLSTLQRGFAIVTTEKIQIVRDADQVKVGDAVNVQLAQGKLFCKVEKKV